MDLEAIEDLINALYRDFIELSYREDSDKRDMYISITEHLKEVVEILRRLREYDE